MVTRRVTRAIDLHVGAGAPTCKSIWSEHRIWFTGDVTEA